MSQYFQLVGNVKVDEVDITIDTLFPLKETETGVRDLLVILLFASDVHSKILAEGLFEL